MLKHFLVPEADQVLVSEDKARAGTKAVFEKMGFALRRSSVVRRRPAHERSTRMREPWYF